MITIQVQKVQPILRDVIFLLKFAYKPSVVTMEAIKLVTPQKQHEKIVAEYIKEHLDNKEYDIHGGALIEKLDYYSWLQQLAGNSDKATVNPNWVVSSTFLVLRESDDKMIGIIDIRHELNDFLASYGGHIGLGVRPSERKKGYATIALLKALKYCKEIGLFNIMLSCYKDNTASRNTIVKCGGKLEKEFPLTDLENLPVQEIDKDKKIVQVFWINLLKE